MWVLSRSLGFVRCWLWYTLGLVCVCVWKDEFGKEGLARRGWKSLGALAPCL